MCFDKNERRLVTAGGDGTVYMWNFNNGSKLREYSHDDEKLELVSVRLRGWKNMGPWVGWYNWQQERCLSQRLSVCHTPFALSR